MVRGGRPVRRDAASESGGVLVMVALWAPVLILLTTLVIDVSNWFEHKRHLQTQADAAALAGAREFGVWASCSNVNIEKRVGQYSGDPTNKYSQASLGSEYNPQVGGTNQGAIHVLVNASAYWNDGGTDYSGDGEPCANGVVDVKITEANLPWLLRLASVPAINSHARVTIKQVDTLAGTLPIAVPDVTPQAARVQLVNDAGTVVASQPLAADGTSGGLAIWDNRLAPFSNVSVTSNLHVRVILSGNAGTTTCGQPLVSCYDDILYARAYPTAGSGLQPNAPIARDVQLFNGSCADPYFVASSATCTVGVRATVDFGAAAAANLVWPDATKAPNAIVSATINGTTRQLTWDKTTNTWSSTAAAGTFFTVPTAGGPLRATLTWEETKGTQGGNACKNGNGNKCTGTFGTVQQTHSASDASSGPMAFAQLSEGGVAWADSFASGTTHTLTVAVGLKGTFQLAQPGASNPSTALRVVGGSLNQSIDCDPDYSTIRDELHYGCRPLFTLNTGQPCSTDSGKGFWTSQPKPYTCVPVRTGGSVGQVSQGMDDRILAGGTCAQHPNNWGNFPNLDPNDTRIIPLMVTPFGTFTGSGSNENVKIINFASFYITGWGHNGSKAGCPGDEPVDAGNIVGHFIKYVSTLPSGGGGSQPCDFASIGTCVAVMTE